MRLHQIVSDLLKQNPAMFDDTYLITKPGAGSSRDDYQQTFAMHYIVHGKKTVSVLVSHLEKGGPAYKPAVIIDIIDGV